MSKLLEIRNLSAAYGQIEVIHGLNLEVNQGEIVALIGSNGAGKSTLLRTISGLMRPTAGEVIFQGKCINDLKTNEIVKSGLIHVPEGRAILKRMTIEDNLLTGAVFRSKKEIQEDLEEAFRLFPILKERRKQLAGTLSGGQQQMLAIARGLMARPSLLMLDEPSLGLAPLVIKDIFRLIQELKTKGITILIVEQNARQTLRISDRAYVLETGHIALSGNSGELLKNDVILKAYLGENHHTA
ncbi:ABC transporter ATP-binding protein [Effusibacillus consociatus]|uniref:ABC transporter ATP-binding protein n=1 Tax=Effusibacillus consociatus TaxID=1117041 RepID=A0ABV9PZL0_9BACL